MGLREGELMVASRTVHDAADVDDEVLGIVEDAAQFFEGEPRVDWDRYWDRLDQYGVFVDELDCPAAAKIERHVRALRREQ